MLFKVSSVLATIVAAVAFAAREKDDPMNEDKPLSDGNGNVVKGVTYPVSLDMLFEILSFLPPFEWGRVRRVDSYFYASLGTVIRNYFGPTLPFRAIVYSEETKMEDALKSVLNQPGFRGVIFNKDECTLINHSLRGSQVCSEKGFDGRVRITGVAHVKRCDPSDESKCNDIFLHRTDYPLKLHARNIRTGKDITIGDISRTAKAIIANEKQLVIVTENKVLMYELDWNAKKAECVLQETKEGIKPSDSKLLTDECGDVSSVICLTQNGFHNWDVNSKQWKMVQETEGCESKLSPDGKIVFRSENGISIETTDGKTTLLNIPGVFHSNLCPSPDSEFVGFRICYYTCLMSLRTGEITVLNDDLSWHPVWVSANLFRMYDEWTFVLRCAHNPYVDLGIVNEDTSLIQQVMLDDEVNAGDLVFGLKTIGPNLYYSQKYGKVIQLQWLGNHPN